MFSLLLKKALPFTLTLVVGFALGGLFRPSPPAATIWTWADNVTPALGREGPFGHPHGRGHDHCRMRPRNLVAVTKPLVILFKPDARWPRGAQLSEEGARTARVLVTFGADGKVQQVEPGNNCLIAAGQDLTVTSKDSNRKAVWDAVERAARQIQFEPELINSLPVSVTKEIEIRFMLD